MDLEFLEMDAPAALQILARANDHDLAFWRLHPDVADVVASPAANEPGSIEVRLELREPPANFRAVRTPLGVKPDRPADIEIGADGPAHPTFWDRLPEVQRIELFQEYLDLDHDEDPEVVDDEPGPGGWWHARIWLKR
jgi:hypothetical protein